MASGVIFRAASRLLKAFSNSSFFTSEPSTMATVSGKANGFAAGGIGRGRRRRRLLFVRSQKRSGGCKTEGKSDQKGGRGIS